MFLNDCFRVEKEEIDKEHIMQKSSHANEEDRENVTIGFLDIIYSWTLKDVLNENLYKNKVLLPPISHENVHLPLT